jgi:hypothetical protein
MASRIPVGIRSLDSGVDGVTRGLARRVSDVTHSTVEASGILDRPYPREVFAAFLCCQPVGSPRSRSKIVKRQQERGRRRAPAWLA